MRDGDLKVKWPNGPLEVWTTSTPAFTGSHRTVIDSEYTMFMILPTNEGHGVFAKVLGPTGVGFVLLDRLVDP